MGVNPAPSPEEQALDRLLDILAAELVEQYMAELAQEKELA